MIGTKIWYKGDEVTITSDPYMDGGMEWINAVREDGVEVVMITEAQRSVQVNQAQRVWREQQKGFARLHKAKGD